MLRSWSVRISLFAVLLAVLGPLLASVGLLSGLYGFFLYGLGALVGFLGVVAGIITAVRGRPRPGLMAVGLGLVVMVVVVFPGFASGGRPRINDISTDLDDVPAFTQAGALPANQGRDMRYPDEFKPVVREFYKTLKPLSVNAPPDEVFQKALALAREQPHWQVTAVDVNQAVVDAINEGHSHVGEEPGLVEAVAAAHHAGRLRATIDGTAAARSADVVVIIVPVMLNDRHEPDYRYMDAAAAAVGPGLHPGSLVIFETTLPVGDTRGRLSEAKLRAS
jgi:hypothetical protein